MFNLKLTRLAKAIATAKYSPETVETRAREELGGLDIDDPTKIFLHCFRMPNNDDIEFICLPDHEGGIIVDTVSFEEFGEPLADGPLKGKRLSMPTPDSQDED